MSPLWRDKSGDVPFIGRSLKEPGVGYAADDGAALHFAGSALAEVVSSRPKRRHIESSRWTDASSRLDCQFASWVERAPQP